MGNGTKNIIPLIEKNPFIMTSSSGIIRENEYIYPIVLSPSGISGFLEDLSIFYAGSGISQDMKRELTGFLEGMTSTGELHISTLEPTYFSLSLSMTASGV